MADFSLWTRAQKIAGRTTRGFLRESLNPAVSKNLKKYVSQALGTLSGGSPFTTGTGNAGVALSNVVQ
jgi:hypothetical protein